MSNETKQVEVGSKVIVKVGCREIEATVLEVTENGCRVKSLASGKEFNTARIVSIAEPSAPANTEPQVESEPTDAEPKEPENTAEDETPNPAPESGKPDKPAKKMSLLDAAVEVLKTSPHPMNTREMVKAAVDAELWIPTSCKTPEQTLYGSIFREIATKEQPRIVKSEQKGKFILG